MRFRQVHLDFHTSEKITGIGSRFSKEQFQNALKIGHVDSITLFAKCHHGWAYFPSKANEIHPHLDFDLLGSQIEAAHEIGVKTPVYLSAGLDEKLARRHPEWLIRPENDQLNWKQAGYHEFCMNSPYIDYFMPQVEEVVRNYDVDGIFLDIVGVRVCYCQNCINTLVPRGKEPYVFENHLELGEEVYANYLKRAREAVDKYKKGLPLFHNSGHVRRGRRDLAYASTHLELESLPTGGWGYDHFPLSSAYARTLNMEYLGMTGKFHTTWGEFGGFKHPNALLYETALSLANGAKCSVGDQLHPLGFMDEATYKLIGIAYQEVEKKEEWCDNVESVADIAILSEEAIQNYYNLPANSPGDVGAARILLEGKYLFDVVDQEACLDKYKLLILPDTIRIDSYLKEKMDKFIQKGGRILATGLSALYKDRDEFAFDLGAEYAKASDYRPIYIRPQFDVLGLETAFVTYQESFDIVEKDNAEVLAFREDPYFNRSAFSFSSHQHTPNNPDVRKCAITMGKDGIYICSMLFREYAQVGAISAKEIVRHALDTLLGDKKTLRTNLYAQGVATLMEQKEKNRYVNHLLYAVPVKRGGGIEVIEDIIPVYNIDVEIKMDRKPKRVYLAPENEDIGFTYENNIVSYTVPEIYNHAMVVIDY